eukprot:scaffold14669_cov152-Isochrysis_galbana.AAC.1
MSRVPVPRASSMCMCRMCPQLHFTSIFTFTQEWRERDPSSRGDLGARRPPRQSPIAVSIVSSILSNKKQERCPLRASSAVEQWGYKNSRS